MKYVIILPDGASDESLGELGGRTPLEIAKIPHMDWVSKNGELGRALTVPTGFTPATDVATMSLFGFDPHKHYTGRAPIEAIAKGLAVRPDQIIWRCNFVTIADGRMKDFTAGHIKQPDADELIAALNHELKDEGCDFFAGVSYRNLMLLANALDMDLKCAPPHDIADQLVKDHWPKGKGFERAMKIMERGKALLENHPVNARRRAKGEDWATNIWLWGQGRPTLLGDFAARFGVKGAVITGVDIVRGLALGMGMQLIPVKGATGYIDTDYDAKGRAAVKALDDYDLVVVHVEAADEAAHLGNAAEKIKALGRIDEAVVGPLLGALRRRGDDWRILIAPDHPTLVRTKGHSAVPPPYCFAGAGISARSEKPFTEAAAIEAGLFLDPGTQVITRFFASRAGN
jgi:2,3-bisphosphoglycerate-independent phosphoglycerate mutase